MNLTSRKRFAAATAVLVLTVTGVAACGGDDDDSASSSSSKTLCDDSQALKSSIDDLKNVDIVENGTSSLSSALTKVTESATTLIDAAKSDFKPQVDELQTSLKTLGTSIKDIPSKGLDPVKEAASGVETSATNLTDAVENEKCG
jgi:uncharacterized phage infection (PIP) family protein YhgE